MASRAVVDGERLLSGTTDVSSSADATNWAQDGDFLAGVVRATIIMSLRFACGARGDDACVFG